MARFFTILCLAVGACCFPSSHVLLRAEAPTPPPAAGVDPGEVSAADTRRFFEKYKEAIQLLERKKVAEAVLTMDLLVRSLSTSPWLEIALMKQAQLLETSNDRRAEELYTLLRERLANAPYFEGHTPRAQIFGVALKGAVDNGINRVRLRRIRDALGRYFARYGEYPESLAKLAILGYTDMENIHAVNNQLFRYVPQSPQMSPFISYKRFELEDIAPEPFVATTPKLEATSQVSEKPLQYIAFMRVGNRREPERLVENQTVQGFFVAAIAHDGVVLSTPTRVLVLLAP
jgi:hypothetical protein